MDYNLIINNTSIRITVIALFFNLLILAYSVSKKIYQKANKDINWAKYPRNKDKINMYVHKLKQVEKMDGVKRILESVEIRLKRAGYIENNPSMYLFWCYIVPIGIGLVGVILGFRMLLLGFLIPLLIEQIITSTINKQENEFRKNIYRVYKSLYYQITAGVNQVVAIGYLYLSAQNKVLKKRLEEMATILKSSNDIERALRCITDYYHTVEAKSFALAIKQGLETGDIVDTLERKEMDMFEKYLNAISFDTEKIKHKQILIAILYMVAPLGLVFFSLVIKILNAKNQIIN